MFIQSLDNCFVWRWRVCWFFSVFTFPSSRFVFSPRSLSRSLLPSCPVLFSLLSSQFRLWPHIRFVVHLFVGAFKKRFVAGESVCVACPSECVSAAAARLCSFFLSFSLWLKWRGWPWEEDVLFVFSLSRLPGWGILFSIARDGHRLCVSDTKASMCVLEC